MGNVSRELYINPRELLQELTTYKQTRVISDELGLILMKIARRFASKSCFSGYSYKEEFVGDAVYRMVEQIDKINLSHANSNPFSYLTQICYTSFISKISKEKKYSKVKEDLVETTLDEFESEENIHFKKNTKEVFFEHAKVPAIVDDTIPVKKKKGYLFFKKKKDSTKLEETSPNEQIIKPRRQRKKKIDRAA